MNYIKDLWDRFMKKGYVDFEEWLVDMDKARTQPEDKPFFDMIARKVKNSSVNIVKEIEIYLYQATLLEENPLAAMLSAAKDSPGSFLLVKTKEDPWFHV